MNAPLLTLALTLLTAGYAAAAAGKNTGVGAKPVSGAKVILNGSRETLDAKWTYWEGPGFKSSLPIKWNSQCRLDNALAKPYSY